MLKAACKLGIDLEAGLVVANAVFVAVKVVEDVDSGRKEVGILRHMQKRDRMIPNCVHAFHAFEDFYNDKPVVGTFMVCPVIDCISFADRHP